MTKEDPCPRRRKAAALAAAAASAASSGEMYLTMDDELIDEPLPAELRESQRVIQTLSRRSITHDKRLGVMESRLEDGNDWFDVVNGRLTRVEEGVGGQAKQLTELIQSDRDRKVREETMATVSQAQQQFWRWVIPLMVTLLFSLVGTVVWIATKLTK